MAQAGSQGRVGGDGGGMCVLSYYQAVVGWACVVWEVRNAYGIFMGKSLCIQPRLGARGDWSMRLKWIIAKLGVGVDVLNQDSSGAVLPAGRDWPLERL
jgi:hypothetical protein